ncbi:TetR/AcrR family transcriptional regulator [Metabacillus litoralis]|uniref:TetR/AcrR family transcriptional regulator n=1 Tax=Metabacillus litoralis TaxID=152268 RepID=UPI000EF5BC26|nr:TetR/AcrR family transcriptional regulator [Metabacillus litoralis]MCM3412107.1 TetR/AcrR family transcriptional regulator [Metabacillus litoralis]UHA61887.1 TetR/AcrR family transcriptional regulator [Metabacillus litoralis]
MMSAIEIKQSGIQQFAQHGYDGTSLSLIANDVGIKKQSIYSHFANKDELFLTILDEVIEDEKNYIRNYFLENEKLELRSKLYHFLINSCQRYEREASMKFLLRNGFLPPSHLHGKVMEILYTYYDEVELIVLNHLQSHQPELVFPIKEVAVSYIGLFDSLLVELLYGGFERFQRRLNACWNIYWKGISS